MKLIQHSKRIGAALATIAALQFAPTAYAEIVETDQLASHEAADAERAKVKAFFEQATVIDKMKALGVDGLTAQDRIAAMSQAEIHTLAQGIDTLPAGGAWSNTEVVIGLLVLILIAIII